MQIINHSENTNHNSNVHVGILCARGSCLRLVKIWGLA